MGVTRMSQQISKNQVSPFDAIRQVDNTGREYWSARDLQKLLKYTRWEKFEDAIDRAMIACKNSGQDPEINFHPEVKPTLSRGCQSKLPKKSIIIRASHMNVLIILILVW